MIKVTMKRISGFNSKLEVQTSYFKELRFMQISENEDSEEDKLYIQSVDNTYANILIKDIKSGDAKIEIFLDENTGAFEGILVNKKLADYGVI